MSNNNNIADKAGELKNAIINNVEMKINDTKQNITNAIDNEKKFAENKVNEAKDNISAKIDNEKKFAENKVNEVKQGFADKVAEAGNAVDGIRNAVAGKISNLASKVSADNNDKA